MKKSQLRKLIKEEIKSLLTEDTNSGYVCCCNGQGSGTTFFDDGSTCDNPNIQNCQNQEMQGNYSNMVPWNMVNTYSEAGAGSSFPGNAEINGQIPVGIWSTFNPGSCTYGGNDFGMPYVWFTQQLTDENGNCIPNPINCQVEEEEEDMCAGLEEYANSLGIQSGIPGVDDTTMSAADQFCIKCQAGSYDDPKCECCDTAYTYDNNVTTYDPDAEGIPPLPNKDMAPLKGKPKMDPQIARMQTLAKIPQK